MNKFYDNLLHTIEKYNLIESGDRIVVGLSGGADSCALLHSLSTMFEGTDVKLFAAHLNHGIRKEEAKRDQLYSEDFSKRCLVDFVTKEVDVPSYARENKISDEMAGRALRYDFFYEVCEKYNCNKIAVAHNKNDNAETILLNLIRGTGSNGFEGIKPKNGKIIRPLINTSRKEIEEYSLQNKIEYVTDSTNLSDIYARNIIRNQILPKMNEINSAAIDNILRFSDIISQENSFINGYIKNSDLITTVGDSLQIDRKKFELLHPAIRRRTLLKAIIDFRGSTVNISMKQIDALSLNIKTGNTFTFGSECKATVNATHILFTKQASDEICYEYRISIPGKIKIKEIGSEYKFEYVTNYVHRQNSLCISADNLDEKDVFIRSRQPGDTFVPYGMKGSKKIKSFFIDAKIPAYERQNFPLLVNKSEICCIFPLRVSENYKVTESTKKILMITLVESTYDEQ